MAVVESFLVNTLALVKCTEWQEAHSLGSYQFAVGAVGMRLVSGEGIDYNSRSVVPVGHILH
jgi:hypothetical protein